jgi:predicted dehydrogenase
VKTPIRIGIIGMGGFAGAHHQAILKLEERGHARLICTCDPNVDAFRAEQQNWKFAARGVQVFADYRSMLDACHRQLDMVVIATPIQLHVEMHDVVTSLGLPAYLEKPPTLDHAQLEKMIAADRRARKSSLVGFNFIVQKSRLSLKERLLSGEFGAIRGATLSVLWPRPAGYFTRNRWAGRLVVDDHLVLDSCFGNAMGHFVHNLLFWTGGPDLFSWAQVAAVRAELYRAHAIEGADTFFVEIDTTDGITLRVAMSHACAGASAQREVVLCDHATLRYSLGQDIEIRWNDGRTENLLMDPFDPLVENHREYIRYLNGETPRPATTLTDSRPFVAVNDLAYVSSGEIVDLPRELISLQLDEKEQKDYLRVEGMRAAHEHFLAKGLWPSSVGWRAMQAEVVTPADLARFETAVRRMAAGTQAEA